jgi:hypothetical protein
MRLPSQSTGVARGASGSTYNDLAYITASACDPWTFKCTSNDGKKSTCCGYEACCCTSPGNGTAYCCYPGQSCWGTCCQH